MSSIPTNSVLESNSLILQFLIQAIALNLFAPHLPVFLQSLNHHSNLPSNWSARVAVGGDFGHSAFIYQLVKCWQLR